MSQTTPFEIVEGPHDDVRIKLRDKLYSVPEVSGMILQEMRLIAEEYLGEEVEEAVITVPAYFHDGQRQGTKDAGRIAGLNVLRIINEPTAAALAYGTGRNLDQTIAVYDLGGGTFDVSVLRITDGVFDVLSSSGDSFLGGEDLDARVIEHLAYDFANEQAVDLRKDAMALQRLKDAAEKAKCDLSSREEVDIHLPFIHTVGANEALHLQTTLSREKLEELTVDLVERTFRICEKALDDAGLGPHDIDEVILVGGQTRMPLVQRSAERFFGRPPRKGVHPDEAVAVGAAIQADRLNEGSGDVILLDVIPHSLGVMVYGGGFEVLIERNSTVPVEEGHIFTTVKDHQTSVKIIVLQGESERAEENELLGEFVLGGLRPAPAGQVEIEIKFSISADGIVSVAAKDLETGMAQSITVTATSGLTEDEIHDMISENEEYMLEVKRSEEIDEHRSALRRRIREVEGLLPRVTDVLMTSSLGNDTLTKANEVIDRARQNIDGKSMDHLLRDVRALERTLSVFQGIVQRVPEQ